MSVRSNLYWAGVAATAVNALHKKKQIVRSWEGHHRTAPHAATLSQTKVFVPLVAGVSLAWPVTLPLAVVESVSRLRKLKRGL